MAGNKILKVLAAQFGVKLDDPEEDAARQALERLSPEQRRQAEIELKATIRGKVVPKPIPPSFSQQQPAIGQPYPQAQQAAPMPAPGASAVDEKGNVDFTVLYAQAGVHAAKFTAEQALDIIKDCDPSDAARRQTIKVIATFGRNVGATPDEIVVDAVDKQDAIHAFMDARNSDLETLNGKADEQIAALMDRIEQIKTMKQAASQQHDAVQAACELEVTRLEQVLDFFRQETPAGPGA